MDTNKILDLATGHPASLQKLLDVINTAVQADPALLPALITAYKTKGWTAFALKHLALIAQVAGVLTSDPVLAKDLATLGITL